MKKLTLIVITILTVFVFFSCTNTDIEKNNKNGIEITSFVPVSSVSGLPTSGFVGFPILLTGTVEPPDATNNAIIWSIEASGGTSPALDGNILSAALPGRIMITAAIANGSTEQNHFSISFYINITEFIPVSGITNVPVSGKAGQPFSLTGTVMPSNATYKTITWLVKEPGTTGAEIGSNNVLTANAAGTVIVTGVIINGLTPAASYSDEFSITIGETNTDPDPVSAINFVKNLGVGVNIGNTLDAIGTNTWHSGETGWGNPVINREFIQALKNFGYKTIRLPVTWAEYIGPGPDYLIGDCVFPDCSSCPNRMDRVEQVVNWILDEGMYCILNLHHDGGESDKSWILEMAANETATLVKFNAVWNQIAQRFRDTPDTLILEAMNEVGFDSVPKAQAYNKMNLLNQNFVNTVRNSGSSNAARFLLIAGYWTDIDRSCDPLFLMPQDSAQDKLILSVHYYTPATFCIPDNPNNSWGFRDSWGTSSDRTELSNQINKLKTNFISKSIPVILGEYGVAINNKVEQSRIDWMTAVTQICLDNGICPVLWDTGGEINRRTFVMRDSLKAVWQNIVLLE